MKLLIVKSSLVSYYSFPLRTKCLAQHLIFTHPQILFCHLREASFTPTQNITIHFNIYVYREQYVTCLFNIKYFIFPHQLQHLSNHLFVYELDVPTTVITNISVSQKVMSCRAGRNVHTLQRNLHHSSSLMEAESYHEMVVYICTRPYDITSCENRSLNIHLYTF
jgi:hypothetical protein